MSSPSRNNRLPFIIVAVCLLLVFSALGGRIGDLVAELPGPLRWLVIAAVVAAVVVGVVVIRRTRDNGSDSDSSADSLDSSR